MKHTYFALLLVTSLNIFSVKAYASMPKNVIVHDGLTLSQFFTQCDVFMKRYTANGLVDYASIKSDRLQLNKLISTVASSSLTGATSDTKLAFYINAYNLLVINTIVINYPVASPLDIKGLFDVIKVTVAGESMTLNDLESNKLRPDARVHFVLVCGALGCPKIMNGAYFPETVQSQLNTQTKTALNDPDFIKVNDKSKQVSVSKIFEWYNGDFVRNGGSVIAFINNYRTNSIPKTYGVTMYDYNWELNKK